MKIYFDDRETRNTNAIEKLMERTLEELQKKNKKWQDVFIEKSHLSIGDIVCHEKSIVIERKSSFDFYSSINSQHIFDQAKQMQSFQNRFIIISGSYSDLLSNIHLRPHINVWLGAIASLATKYNTTVVTTENDKQLVYLALKIIEKTGEPLDLTPTNRLKVTKDSRIISALTATEGISLSKAERVVKEFKTIRDICNSTEEDLCKVDGIGKKLAKNIKEIF